MTSLGNGGPPFSCRPVSVLHVKQLLRVQPEQGLNLWNREPKVLLRFRRLPQFMECGNALRLDHGFVAVVEQFHAPSVGFVAAIERPDAHVD